ncbi:Imm26 family immunity protein [Phyllobacterium myrsinacearum]|uniref:Immunity protein 26 of polymorphic toxin system n=1 Tax=Phyllobacterium myrsinacearum TaxID=28101 RepID=A0A839EXY5_9HYPH|nr:Imm26 family immunity protein [Phyllobacterium myrsinacearum]MBA8882146.1 hypothetical protein [Phyllobacterium myrsinacearum]
MATVKRERGNIFEVPINDELHGYAITLAHPLYGFYDLGTKDDLTCAEIVSRPIAFKIFVMDNAPKKGNWKKIGWIDPGAEIDNHVVFFRQDLHTGKLTGYDKGKEWPISYEEALKLETAAVWSANHIADRLRDHFAGQPNKWVESMKPKPTMN